jgi:chromosome partitioning protein
VIIAVGGTKGGTGKSTIATNVAVMLARAGRDVLLVDADEQETSVAFTNMRNQTLADGAGYTCIPLTGRAVMTEIRRLAPKYSDIVIDVGGSNAASQRGALALAQVYVVPFAPRSFDIWTLDKVVALIEESSAVNPDLKAFALLNRADSQGTENDAAAAIIREQDALTCLKVRLGNRKAYPRAATAGLSVVELSPKDPKAVEEVEQLFREVGLARELKNRRKTTKS